MVYNECCQKYDSNKIDDVKGGCNPAKLNHEVDDNDLIINVDDLENGRWYFE